VQAGNDDTALIIKPYYNPTALRVDGGVVSTWNPIPIATAGDNDERLKGPSMQKLTDITYHRPQPSRTGPEAQAGLIARRLWRRGTESRNKNPLRNDEKLMKNDERNPNSEFVRERVTELKMGVLLFFVPIGVEEGQFDGSL